MFLEKLVEKVKSVARRFNLPATVLPHSSLSHHLRQVPSPQVLGQVNSRDEGSAPTDMQNHTHSTHFD